MGLGMLPGVVIYNTCKGCFQESATALELLNQGVE